MSQTGTVLKWYILCAAYAVPTDVDKIPALSRICCLEMLAAVGVVQTVHCGYKIKREYGIRSQSVTAGTPETSGVLCTVCPAITAIETRLIIIRMSRQAPLPAITVPL